MPRKVLCLLAGLLSTGVVRAATPPLHDRAGLFSEPAKMQANEELLELSRQYRSRIVIETFPDVPWLAKVWHDLKSPETREQFFLDWAKRRAQRVGSHGLYVLISKEPTLHIEVEPARNLKGFSAGDAARFDELLLAQFKQEHFDRGLLEGIQFIRRQFQSSLGAGVAIPEVFPWLDILWIVLILVAFWACIEFIHALAI